MSRPSPYIYRLVTDKGLGPYHGGGLSALFTDEQRGRYYEHPGPRDFGEGVYEEGKAWRFPLCEARTSDHLFGFACVTQARNWFCRLSHLRKMERAGWRVRVYRRADVRSVVDGFKQTMFIPDFADFVELPPSILRTMGARQVEREVDRLFTDKLCQQLREAA